MVVGDAAVIAQFLFAGSTNQHSWGWLTMASVHRFAEGAEAARFASPWLTTAPHATPRTAARRLPWGRAHARRNGSPWTLCGLPATSWLTFWEVPFTSKALDPCPVCAFAAGIDVPAAPHDRAPAPADHASRPDRRDAPGR